MQFSQPIGFEHYGPPYAFNTPFQANGYPQVIGEGNVTSVMAPDGGTQLLFLPTTQWSRPYPPNVANLNNPYWNNLGAWFVRNVNNQLYQPVFSPQYPQPCGINHYPRNSSSDCSLNFPFPGYQLKFHNDICTSTSDIHYFCPKQCNWFQKPQGFAAIQTSLPVVPMVMNSVSHHEVVCTKPCNCTAIEPCSCTKHTEKQITCTCSKKTNSNSSAMSCDESKTKVCAKKKDKKKTHKLKGSHSSNRSNHECQCKDVTLDKSVTTYTDRASGCVEEKSRQIQTVSRGRPIIQIKSGDCTKMDIETELWMPKTNTAKKVMKAKTSEIFSGVCESGCSDSSSCHSGTDLDE